MANVADVANVADDEENRNVNEAADNSDTPLNSDGKWMEQDHREDPGSQEEARSHSRVGEACEAIVQENQTVHEEEEGNTEEQQVKIVMGKSHLYY